MGGVYSHMLKPYVQRKHTSYIHKSSRENISRMPSGINLFNPDEARESVLNQLACVPNRISGKEKENGNLFYLVFTTHKNTRQPKHVKKPGYHTRRYT